MRTGKGDCKIEESFIFDEDDLEGAARGEVFEVLGDLEVDRGSAEVEAVSRGDGSQECKGG